MTNPFIRIFMDRQAIRIAVISVAWFIFACPSPGFGDKDLPKSRMTELAAAPPETGVNASPTSVEGILGRAWRFDGTDDSLRLTINEAFQSTNALTLACWIKLDDLPGPAEHTIASFTGKDGDETRLFVLRPMLKGRNYRVGLSCGRTRVTSDDPDHFAKHIMPTFTSGLWYQFGVTIEESKIVFYVDGVPVHGEELTEPLSFTLQGGLVGLDQSGEAPFAGLIGEIRVSSTVWSAEQIAALYWQDLGAQRTAINRAHLIADDAEAEQHLDDPNSPWSKALRAQHWYAKSWQWQPLSDRFAFTGDTVTVIASFDSPDKDGADIVCDGEADDIDIQRALDAVPDSGGKILLREGTYHLSNVLRPKSNTEIEIDGMLRIDNAISSPLIKDAMTGDKTYHVADASKFRVGQWVTAVDDASTDHKGGWSNWLGGRKYGECSVIASIDGNAITIQEVPDEYAGRTAWDGTPRYGRDYLVERNAFLVTSHSAILIQGRHHVFIHGSGSVFGNRMKQLRTAPNSNWQGWEEMRANSGIVVFDSTFVHVEGLSIHDANLHNVTFWMAENCTAEKLNVFGANDKNIALVSTNRMRLVRNYSHDSVCEDGIIFYVLGHGALVSGNRLTDNPRFGLRFHNSCRFVTPLGNMISGNRLNTIPAW